MAEDLEEMLHGASNDLKKTEIRSKPALLSLVLVVDLG